jgi:hypothetical protein
MELIRQMWGGMGFSLPGMVTPTFDTLEISKRITDLKAVEGWLRMNLSMLQMTIQGLEMQNTTLSTVQAMGKMAYPEEEAKEGPTVGETLQQAALWPWNLMQQVQQQVQDQLQQNAAEEAANAPPAPEKAPAKTSATAAASKAAPRKTTAKKPAR